MQLAQIKRFAFRLATTATVASIALSVFGNGMALGKPPPSAVRFHQLRSTLRKTVLAYYNTIILRSNDNHHRREAEAKGELGKLEGKLATILPTSFGRSGVRAMFRPNAEGKASPLWAQLAPLLGKSRQWKVLAVVRHVGGLAAEAVSVCVVRVTRSQHVTFSMPIGSQSIKIIDASECAVPALAEVADNHLWWAALPPRTIILVRPGVDSIAKTLLAWKRKMHVGREKLPLASPPLYGERAKGPVAPQIAGPPAPRRTRRGWADFT